MKWATLTYISACCQAARGGILPHTIHNLDYVIEPRMNMMFIVLSAVRGASHILATTVDGTTELQMLRPEDLIWIPFPGDMDDFPAMTQLTGLVARTTKGAFTRFNAEEGEWE